MNFNYFVIPFSVGAIILFAVLITRYSMWMVKLPRADRKKAWRGVFSTKIFRALWEVFLESLVHRKIFKINALLGWMHMSFALGWFLLILIGTIESKFNYHQAFNSPYDPIFLRFFEHSIHNFEFSSFFTFVMDFLLLILLSATVFAISKRIYSFGFGMKKTTKLHTGDKIALYSLWLVFPMRFLAESFTAGLYNNGGFLTQTSGDFFAAFLPLQKLELTAWWGYSCALCIFFLFLPFSRYMHIPTEIFLIYLKKCGIKTGKRLTGFSEFEIYSCSRCGICIDKCQITGVCNNPIQSVYFLQDTRRNVLDSEIAYQCLLCGRCTTYCPVGIDITNLRQIKREDFAPVQGFNFNYLENTTTNNRNNAEIVYFAGCMTHLTPSIIVSMEIILKASGYTYIFADREGSICCGRPLMLAGNPKQAKNLIIENKKLFTATKAKILITSCPICYHVFKNEYKLEMEVLHHSEFINHLISDKKIKLKKSNKSVVYHDPCDLGRGKGIFDEPRNILRQTSILSSIEQENQHSLCCGGSLGDFKTSLEQKKKISLFALEILCKENPDEIITACPLCKKTFAGSTKTPVKDIAEVVSEAMI